MTTPGLHPNERLARRPRGLDRAARALGEDGGEDELRIVCVEAPVTRPERLLSTAESDAVLWAPPSGPACAAIGTAARIEADGPDRFRRIRERAASVWARVDRRSDEGPPPRLFGGFAFDSRADADSVWGAFGEAAFTLPRLTYVVDDGAAWLQLAVHGRELAERAERDRWMDRLGSTLDRLGSADEPSGPRSVRQLTRREVADEQEWIARVEAIRSAIAEGRFEKIVAAQRALLTFSPPPDPLSVIGRLRTEAERCTLFAFRRGAATFLGATPERLVTRCGRHVETEALAGSIASDAEHRARTLLASTKDLVEHEIVVRDIVDSLRPVCVRVDHPQEPTVHALRHVLHLRTPVEATLADDVHVVDLVERLHPTPAVGGVPKRDAVEWIAEHEPTPRGWYAGPIGWFDAQGDGGFDVALRSGVLVGADAHVYAGAGIVRDSDPKSELEETELKLKALLSALDAVP